MKGQAPERGPRALRLITMTRWSSCLVQGGQELNQQKGKLYFGTYVLPYPPPNPGATGFFLGLVFFLVDATWRAQSSASPAHCACSTGSTTATKHARVLPPPAFLSCWPPKRIHGPHSLSFPLPLPIDFHPLSIPSFLSCRLILLSCSRSFQ